MGDSSGDNKPSIPAWQHNYVQNSAGQPKSEQPETSSPDSNDHTQLQEQGRAFLNDESIRDAPREEKVAFLEAKGISKEDIDTLFQSQSQGASTASDQDTQMKTIHDSSSTAPQKAQTSIQTPATSQAPSKRDLPPVITYPEFLLKPTKPPPLITVNSLINLTYALAGLTALTYGTSEFIMKSMLETLTSARHELAEAALTSLNKLNIKLEANVSHVPVIINNPSKTHPSPDSEDLDSDFSDPTELFHRDFGTQTTPRASRSPSQSSSTSSNSYFDPLNPTTSGPQKHSKKDHTSHQAAKLSDLKTLLTSLTTSTTTHFAQDDLDTTLRDTQSYLDELQAIPYTARHTPSGSYSTYGYNYPTTDSGASARSTATPHPASGVGGVAGVQRPKRDGGDGETGRDREAAKFKAEIRALKGAFLSSKNFPTATGLRNVPAASAGVSGRTG